MNTITYYDKIIQQSHSALLDKFENGRGSLWIHSRIGQSETSIYYEAYKKTASHPLGERSCWSISLMKILCSWLLLQLQQDHLQLLNLLV